MFARRTGDFADARVLIPIVVTGFAMSFLFVPIASVGTATLSNREMGNATGIFNLMRNIGGSIGISMAQTALVRRADFHQARIAATVPQSGYWFQQHMASMSQYFAHFLGPLPENPQPWLPCISSCSGRHCYGHSLTCFAGPLCSRFLPRL